MEIEDNNNNIDKSNQNQIQKKNNCPDNQNINEDNSENYIYDFDGIFQKLTKEKNKPNRNNEYLCNLLFYFSPITPLGKLELLKLLYSFNSNPNDYNYKYYIFKELYTTIESLKQNEIINYDFKQLIELLLEQAKFFNKLGNTFYSYFFLYNSLYRDMPNIKNLRSYIKEELIIYNNKNKEQFRKLNKNQYQEILKKLEDIYKSKNDDNYYGTLYVINKKWIIRAYNFVGYILNYNGIEERLNESFNLYQVYNYYFGREEEGKKLYPYPGPINNYIISDFKDIWEDPKNEDENYLINDNYINDKDYSLAKENDWNMLKSLFGATNEIKRKGNTLTFFKIKVIILDKRIIKNNNLNLLRPKYIQTRKNMNIKEFKEKIIRCFDYALKKNEKENYKINEDNFENIDEKNAFEEDINIMDITSDKENEQNNNNENELMKNINIYQNINNVNEYKVNDDISFYKIRNENKELLIEIFTAFIKGLPVYESTNINKIKLKDEMPLKEFFSCFDELNDIIIIEIKQRNYNFFLSEKEKNEKGLYQCSFCKNWEQEEKKYICNECDFSFFCSKSCSSLSDYHNKLLHEYLRKLKIKNNNDSLKYNSYNCVGLMNLGNTCFINSTLQCLLNTVDLSDYFLDNFDKIKMNNQNNHGYKGEITESLANLFKKMKNANTSRINPIDFLRVFFRKNKSLNTSDHQDAQEFLLFLLDYLHEDLNRINEKPYIILEEQKETESDYEASERFWDLYQKRENSIIVDLFHGQYKSKITCSDCGKTSIYYDPFTFLGLPIPQRHNQEIIKFYFGNKWEYFGFEFKTKSTILDLKRRAVEYMKMCNYRINETDDILYNIFELVQFDENKIIKKIYNDDKQLFDNDLLSTIFNKDKSLEIVLYEKNIDKDFFNIYAYPIKGDDYDSSFYPLVISVKNDMTLNEIIEENKEKILKMYVNITNNEYIKIGLLHKKNSGWFYYFTNNFDSREYCPLCNNKEDNYCDFNSNNIKIGYILKKLRNYAPILFAIGCPEKKVINDKIMQIPYKLNKGFFFLDDCLRLFCEEEILNNDNMWYCNKCKKHKTAKKQIKLFKLPRYLIIQLKRFSYTLGFFSSSNEKKYTFIKYPIKDLDLSKYVEDKKGNVQKYDLYAVIQHHGEISQGHYTAICKVNDIWVLYNDSLLSKINNPITNDAYLLFYRKKDQN